VIGLHAPAAVVGPLVDGRVIEAKSNPLLEASPGLMIWTLVCFGITLFILKRYVFGPISRAVESRRARIAESLEEAERSRDEALRLLEDYQQRLAAARREADELRERGRQEGERQRTEILARAHEESERRLTDGQAQLEAQTRQAMAGIRDDVASLALLAAEKVTRRSLSDEDHRRLIEEALREADLAPLKGTSGNGASPNGGPAT
jgi:F-type H+-transporting ATPase subunit b